MGEKKKKYVGMSISNRELTREDIQNLSDEEFKKLGVPIRFWPWYFRFAWRLALFIVVLFILMAAFGYGVSFLAGEPFDYMPLVRKFALAILIAPAAPVMILIVSYTFWYGSIAIEKLRKRYS